jgi:hypothetical protein
MKTKRTLPPSKIGRAHRRNVEMSQKKVREAIDAAFKRISAMTVPDRMAHSAESVRIQAHRQRNDVLGPGSLH